jgi:hypothetical protein
MKKLVLLLSVLMPLAVLPATVEAKKDDKYQLAQYAAEPFMNAEPLVTGALKRFVINPEGGGRRSALPFRLTWPAS